MADRAAEHPDSLSPLRKASPTLSIDEKLDDRISSQVLICSGNHFKPTTRLESFATNGEPVITTGEDVSRYVVHIRDDGDNPLTFRSLFLGTVFAAMSSALSQIYFFKPINMPISTVFLLLMIYVAGTAWATVVPSKSRVEGTRFAKLAPFIEFLNPLPFGIKEHIVATVIASTAARGSTAVQNFAVQQLYYNTKVDVITAVLATFSTATFGCGLCGVLRPVTAFHFDVAANSKRIRLFWITFTVSSFYEVVPAYIFPTLNGINIFCLASQRASATVRNVFTNIFGGADANEGLGLLSLSLDWQYIGSMYMSLPLLQQGSPPELIFVDHDRLETLLLANTWIGCLICYVAILAIYYSNTWSSLAFPMLSTSLFSSNGSIYDQDAIFDSNFQLNRTALNEVGLPALAGSNAWANLTANLAMGGLIAHCVLFWGPYVAESIKQFRAKTQPDRHWQRQAMQKYEEAPWWWYLLLLVVAFFSAGLIVVLKGHTTLPWWSYILALMLGTFITPFSTLIQARLGSGIQTVQLTKMVAGAVHPGRPIANLYFSMWSNDVSVTSMHLAADLKLGQYLKVPPRVMFFAQIWGTVVGAVASYGNPRAPSVVMNSIVNAQREILLDPIGSNIWSGQQTQALNSAAVTWSLAKELYGFDGPYWAIPMSLLFGMVPTVLQWLIYKRWPSIGPVKVDSIILPVIYLYSALMAFGVNSFVLSTILVGMLSQLWLRRHHPGWYKRYNYILGGALDGGSQLMIFILSFTVFGASGSPKLFPAWAGNPDQGNVDRCNGNGALSN
ncbi:hypothetical protein HWV62_20692 [Athelia sp. TMB]|nr:hypothetical protein HWV62_20692 [Athelia sp. TMB]